MDFPVYDGNPVMWDWSVPARVSMKFNQYYMTSGKQGDAPSGDVMTLFEETFAMKTATSLEGVAEKWNTIKQLMYDSVLWFMPIENKVAPVVYSSRMGNIIENDFMIVSNMQLTYCYIKE